MVWMKQTLPRILGNGTTEESSSPSSPSSCAPWVLTIDGTRARAPKKQTTAAERAISFFVYVAAPDGVLYVRDSEEKDAAAVSVISGYANGLGPSDASGAANQGAGATPKNGFGLIARATALPSKTKKGPLAARISAGPGGAKGRIESRVVPSFIQPPAADGEEGQNASTVSVESFLSRRWNSISSEMPAEDTWKVEDLVKRELRKSTLDIVTATSEAQKNIAAQLKKSSKVEEEDGSSNENKNVLVPEELKKQAERLAEYASLPIIPSVSGTAQDRGNLAVMQVVVTVPFRLELVFLQQSCYGRVEGDASATTSHIREMSADSWTALRSKLVHDGKDLAEEQRRRQQQYQKDLCSSLGLCLPSNDTATTDVVVASRALANLVGSTTHFYGRQLVANGPYPLDDHTKNNEDPSRDARLSEPYHLLTGVPSRSFFPRGFLWDEGFHQLAASQYRPLEITMRVIASWLRTMDKDGWIAREQILGSEARSRVPERFRVQYRDIANPPAMMLPMMAMASDAFCRRRVNAAEGNSNAEITMAVDAEGNAAAIGTAPAAPSFLTSGVKAFCEQRRQRSSCRFACLKEEEVIPLTAPVVAPASASIISQWQKEDDAVAKSHHSESFLSTMWQKLKGTSNEDSEQAVAEQTKRIELLVSLGEADESSTAAQQQEYLLAFYHAAYPLLRRHYRWYQRTQAGAEKGSYRWRGVTNADHNFASGLDDYPRGEVPTVHDENSDLLSWMAFMADSLAEIGTLVGAPEKEINGYREDSKAAIDRLNRIHWDEDNGVYCDWAARINHEVLARQRADPRRRNQQLPIPVSMGKVCHVGYVSIFPLLLRQLNPVKDHNKLSLMLGLLEDGMQLWSPYGLRSLSKSSPFFGTGENYWRGSVWINLNFLAVAALRHYEGVMEDVAVASTASAGLPSSVDGGETLAHEQAIALRDRVSSLSLRLKDAVVGNIVKQYQETGFLWENYDSNNGKGRGTHPFTGWTALVSLLVADRYPV
jgi:Glycosyl hydrolase family 63 C-terminal domain